MRQFREMIEAKSVARVIESSEITVGPVTVPNVAKPRFEFGRWRVEYTELDRICEQSIQPPGQMSHPQDAKCAPFHMTHKIGLFS